MANNGVVISAPINIASDVYSVLGLSGPPFDIGYACKNEHGKINMYSRKKPVRWSDLDLTAVTDPIVKSQWWAGVDGDYGISVNKVMLNRLHVNNGGLSMFQGIFWGYKNPRGLSYNEPFRFGDFNGYTHSLNWDSSGMSNRPVDIAWSDDINFYLTGTFSISLTCAMPQDDLLGFAECIGFNDIRNMYMGLLFQIPSTEEGSDKGYIYKCATFPANLNSGDTKNYTHGSIYRVDQRIFSINVKLTESKFKNYIGKEIAIRPVISDGQVSFGDETDGSITLYSVFPDLNFQFQKKFMLKDKTYNPNYKRPTVTITCTTNRVGDTFTISNLKAVIKRASGDTTNVSYQIYITSVNAEIERYVSAASSWIYYTKTPYHKDLKGTNNGNYPSVTLNYVSGSSVTWSYNTDFTVIASGTEKARALISVGFIVRYNDDSFSGSVVTSEI